jgi:glutathione synthase/RimK-type ligase-like ATP-grasp enzyme
MPKKIIVGSICNRDLEVFNEIKRFSKINYRIKFVNLIKNDSAFSIKYLKKKLKKYNINFLIVKLFSEESNHKVYDAIKTYASNIPRLNSVKSVQICESRKETFKLVEKKCKKLKIPKSFYSINAAFEAVSNGTPLIIKLDTHNIRNLSKYDRIIGVAKSNDDFLKLIREYDVENNSLFFQEYLGKHDNVYKVYIIDRDVQTITSQNLLLQHKLSPLELVHLRAPIEKEFKRQILRLGRKFGMTIFGVDYILKDDIPYIVDINDFPSFRNIPEAISLISDYIYKFCLARQTLGKIPMSLKVKTYMA